MKVAANGQSYDWIEGWTHFPDTASNRTNMAHHSLAITAGEELVAITPDNTQVILFNTDGTIKRAFDCDLIAGHGLAICQERGEEYLWITDSGVKLTLNVNAEGPGGLDLSMPRPSGQVFKVDMRSGAVLWTLPLPEHARYRAGEKYQPTAVAIAPGGDIWVADGYGASLVHRFSRDGALLATLSGEESEAGRMNQPHDIFIDYRKSEPELYVADRMNERVLVYDLNGVFRREFGKDLFAWPSAFITIGDVMVVGGLKGRLSLLDLNDQLIGHLGDNPAAFESPGWPNSLVDGKLVQPPPALGRFRTPHGLAADKQGNLYVSEFVVGGRFIKLELKR